MGGRSPRRGESKINSKRTQGLGLRHHSSPLIQWKKNIENICWKTFTMITPSIFLCFSVKVFGRLVIGKGCKWLLKWQRRVCRPCPSTSLKHIPHCWLCLLRYVLSNWDTPVFNIINMHAAQPCYQSERFLNCNSNYNCSVRERPYLI